MLRADFDSSPVVNIDSLASRCVRSQPWLDAAMLYVIVAIRRADG